MAAKSGKPRKRAAPPQLKTGPKVYSYIRFSTPEQQLGDSERRQVDRARAYAAKQDLDFDEVLVDRGVSSFNGAHRQHGVLGKFLERVNEGKIAPGSILVVEHADRLSREGIGGTLRKIIFALFDRGITIHTISPEGTYKPGCENDPQFIALLLFIAQAHESSRRKSDLGNANWDQKRKQARESGKILTKLHPHWLTIENGKFKPIPAAVKALKMLFQLKLKGLGVWTITATLNESAPWSPREKKKRNGYPGETGKGWNTSFVQKCLRNRALIGEYLPQRKERKAGRQIRVPDPDGPIEGYFPAVIDPAIFQRVQEKLATTKGKSVGGRNGKATNVLQHLTRCG